MGCSQEMGRVRDPLHSPCAGAFCVVVCPCVLSLPSPAVIVAAKPVTVSLRCSGHAGRTCGDVREEAGLHYLMPKSSKLLSMLANNNPVPTLFSSNFKKGH